MFSYNHAKPSIFSTCSNHQKFHLNMKKLVTILICLVYFPTVGSQGYVGYGVANYSGIYKVLFNPSSIVNTSLKADINLFSGSKRLEPIYGWVPSMPGLDRFCPICFLTL